MRRFFLAIASLAIASALVAQDNLTNIPGPRPGGPDGGVARSGGVRNQPFRRRSHDRSAHPDGVGRTGEIVRGDERILSATRRGTSGERQDFHAGGYGWGRGSGPLRPVCGQPLDAHGRAARRRRRIRSQFHGNPAPARHGRRRAGRPAARGAFGVRRRRHAPYHSPLFVGSRRPFLSESVRLYLQPYRNALGSGTAQARRHMAIRPRHAPSERAGARHVEFVGIRFRPLGTIVRHGRRRRRRRVFHFSPCGLCARLRSRPNAYGTESAASQICGAGAPFRQAFSRLASRATHHQRLSGEPGKTVCADRGGQRLFIRRAGGFDLDGSCGFPACGPECGAGRRAVSGRLV